MTPGEALGKAVRAMRLQRGLTHMECALRAETDGAGWHRLEKHGTMGGAKTTSGRGASLAVVFRAAEALGVTPGTLVDEAWRKLREGGG